MRWRRPQKPSPTWHEVWDEPLPPVFEDEATIDVVVALGLRVGDDLPIRWGPGPKRVNDDEADR